MPYPTVLKSLVLVIKKKTFWKK